MMLFADRFDELHQRAIDALGWDDFGDHHYHGALRVLLASLDESANLSGPAADVMAGNIVGSLQGRLYSEQHKKLNPDYRQQPPQRPLFIIGLPRSGTTALHKLLAADPANQALEYWLGQTPMPRPPRQTWPGLPEFQRCRSQLEFIAAAAPEMMTIHEMAADEADECRLLLMQDFANVTFQSNARVPAYEAWLYDADFGPVYRRYRDNLQLIGLGDERRWVLKDPSHLWAPGTLLETFPDACIVQTHRHPRELIPSVSSLVCSARKMLEPDVDPAEVGRRELGQWARVLNNLAELRSARPDLPIHDLHMTELQADPLAAVEAIYRRFDLPMTDVARSALSAWSTNRAHQPGSHRYSAEDFGMTDAEIDRVFAPYIQSLPVRSDG
jgi:hypothetical protein